MVAARRGGRDGEGIGLGQDGGGDGKKEEKETRLSGDVEMDEDALEMELGMSQRAPTFHPAMERCIWLLRPPPQIKLMM